MFDDTAEPEKPDAVFPNNWISTHHDGRIGLFPMYSALRQRERRQDIVEELRKHYRVTEVIDYSAFEDEGCCLEGTGSLVLDHLNKIAYVSLSNRSNPKVVRRFSNDFSYEPVTFTSTDPNGEPIYHTNVMMCIGTAFAMVGLEMIPNKTDANGCERAWRRPEKTSWNYQQIRSRTSPATPLSYTIRRRETTGAFQPADRALTETTQKIAPLRAASA